jgi:large subunit ribosomal protein L13
MGTYYPNPTKPEEVQREWLLVDLEGLTVGRAASRIAGLLRGKHKPIFTPHLDVGDYVVCINADKVKFKGNNKLAQQQYHKFTGYLGNMKSRSAQDMLQRKPEIIIESAVKRMLPKNPLGRATFKKLKVYTGTEHPHAAQNPKPFKLDL